MLSGLFTIGPPYVETPVPTLIRSNLFVDIKEHIFRLLKVKAYWALQGQLFEAGVISHIH